MSSFFILFILITTIILYRAPGRDHFGRFFIKTGIITFAIYRFAIDDSEQGVDAPDVINRNREIIFIKYDQVGILSFHYFTFQLLFTTYPCAAGSVQLQGLKPGKHILFWPELI